MGKQVRVLYNEAFGDVSKCVCELDFSVIVGGVRGNLEPEN